MGLVIRLLDFPPSVRLINGSPHGIRNGIRVHNYVSLRVPCRPPDGLDQRSFRTEKTFLIRVQDRDQRNFRNIQAFPQKVDAHQNVKYVQPHIPDNLRPFQGVDIRMEIFYADSGFPDIIRQILRHPLRQCRDQDLIVLFNLFMKLADQIVDLPLHWTHKNLRIQKPGGPDDLFRP